MHKRRTVSTWDDYENESYTSDVLTDKICDDCLTPVPSTGRRKPLTYVYVGPDGIKEGSSPYEEPTKEETEKEEPIREEPIQEEPIREEPLATHDEIVTDLPEQSASNRLLLDVPDLSYIDGHELEEKLTTLASSQEAIVESSQIPATESQPEPSIVVENPQVPEPTVVVDNPQAPAIESQQGPSTVIEISQAPLFENSQIPVVENKAEPSVVVERQEVSVTVNQPEPFVIDESSQTMTVECKVESSSPVESPQVPINENQPVVEEPNYEYVPFINHPFYITNDCYTFYKDKYLNLQVGLAGRVKDLITIYPFGADETHSLPERDIVLSWTNSQGECGYAHGSMKSQSVVLNSFEYQGEKIPFEKIELPICFTYQGYPYV
jgi:hypothetical protein